MKVKLLGGAALAIALAVSSGAWANPKNSFSSGNWTSVYSDAFANAGNSVFVDNYYGDQDVDIDSSGDNTATATSESYNVSIEAVEVSELSSYSEGYIYQSNYWGDNDVDWNDSTAEASGQFSQASASNGVGNATTQGQSVAAAADVRF
jgi:hypothetical protein